MLQGLAFVVAGVAIVVVGAMQLQDAENVPYVLVAVAVIGAGLACIRGGVAILRGGSAAHQTFVTGIWLVVVGIAAWIVRVIHAWATGLIPLPDLRPDGLFCAVWLTGIGLVLLGAGVEEIRERHDPAVGDLPMGVISICGGLLVLGFVVVVLTLLV